MPNLVYVAPFRSVAAALILTIFFGPIGLFYSSFIGGIIMCALALAGLSAMATMQSVLPMVTVWLFSIVWAMISIRFYNHQLLKKLWLHDSEIGLGKKAPKIKQKKNKNTKDKNAKKALNISSEELERSLEKTADVDNLKASSVTAPLLKSEEKLDSDQESDVKPQWKL